MHLLFPAIKKTTRSSTRKKRLSVKKLKITLRKQRIRTTAYIPTVPSLIEETATSTLDEVVAALRAHGYEEYLSSTLGGERNATSAVRGTLCSAKFLVWSYRSASGAELAHTDVLPWLHKIITKEYQRQLDYSVYLRTQLNRLPSTVRNNAGEVLTCCRWYALFCKEARGQLTGGDLAGIVATTSAIQKAEGRREKKHRSELTMEGKVFRRRMPPGGLAQLQQAVYDRLPWANNLVALKDMDKGTYDEFMRLLYAAMYVCAAQGRVAGVTSLTLKQGKELMEKGHTFTTTFKTAAAWTYQPVMITETTRSLLQVYMDHIRPLRQCPATSAPEASLWLNFAGLADLKLGQKVVRFFRGTIDLHMTTNAIRSLVETTMNEAHLKGDITHEEQQSVHAINGHSGKTTADYYILCDRTNEVTSARNAFERISRPAARRPDEDFGGSATDDSAGSTPLATPLGTPSSAPLNSPQQTPARSSTPFGTPATPAIRPFSTPQSSTPRPILSPSWPQRDALVAADWGTAHPDYGQEGKRACWTDEEVRYIGNYCDAKLARNPGCSNIVADCLKHMHSDPAAISIFHKIHVLDSGRLRNGYRLYQERIARGEWP